MRICLWNINSKIFNIFDIIISKNHKAYKIRTTTLAIYHITYRFLPEVGLPSRSVFRFWHPTFRILSYIQEKKNIYRKR